MDSISKIPPLPDPEENPLNFYQEDIDFEISHPTQLANWIASVPPHEGKTIRALSFIFCSDAYLLSLNVQYLQHDTYTDVITFSYSQSKEDQIEGDIFISVERVRENAHSLGLDFYDELHRVMIHGVLHLLGYEDKQASDKKMMTKKENYYLSQLKEKYS